MPVLNYRYRLMPTPSQASVLGASMRTLGWGWNLMVRRAQQALRLIRRGHAGTCQARLANRMAEKGFVGRRAEKVNKLLATGLSEADARKAVLREMTAKAHTYQRSRLAMELAMVEAEGAKQSQMGSTLGSAWAQLVAKYRNSWEACWKGTRGAPARHRIEEAGWLQTQVASVPAELMFHHPEPYGAFRENWVDLGRFFPARLTKLPARIKAAPVAERERLKAEFRSLSQVRLLQHRPLPEGGIVKDLKITRSTHRPDAEWYVVLAVDVPEAVATKVYPVTGKACGINPARRHALSIVGEDAATPGVDGIEAGPGRPMARAQKKLARLQRKLDRQRRANNPECFDEKGRWIKGKRAAVTSKRMEQVQAQIRALYGRVANQRKEAYRRIAEDLLKRYDTVYLGDWKDEAPKVRRAKKRQRKETLEGAQRKAGVAVLEKLGNRMDRDNALGVFRQVLAEKVVRSGGFKKCILVPEPYTTQACAACRALTGPIGMARQGWWTCSACGHRQLRGRTAAWNILQDGQKAELEQQKISELGPEGAAPTPKMSRGTGKGAGQALKGGGDPAVGRMPSKDGEGASAPRPARGSRKAPTLVASATGPSAPIRAKSTVTPFGSRDAGEGESPTAASGAASGPTAGTARIGLRGNQNPTPVVSVDTRQGANLECPAISPEVRAATQLCSDHGDPPDLHDPPRP